MGTEVVLPGSRDIAGGLDERMTHPERGNTYTDPLRVDTFERWRLYFFHEIDRLASGWMTLRKWTGEQKVAIVLVRSSVSMVREGALHMIGSPVMGYSPR